MATLGDGEVGEGVEEGTIREGRSTAPLRGRVVSRTGEAAGRRIRRGVRVDIEGRMVRVLVGEVDGKKGAANEKAVREAGASERVLECIECKRADQ